MRSIAIRQVVALGLAALAAARAASAQLTSDELMDFWATNTEIGAVLSGVPLSPPARKILANVLAKAQPDECFCGVPPLGPPYPPNPTNDPPPCDDCGIPKVNQAYVWGLAKFESNLWFGTAANVLDLVLGGYLGITNPIQTASFVGEFGRSYVSQVLGIPARIGDWRPPRMFLYDAAAGTLTPKDGTNTLNALARGRLQLSTGLRSAGVWPGDAQSPTPIAFLAGPRLATNGGLQVFAFNARSGAFISSTTLGTYNNIRKWVFHDGALYTGVGATNGGFILRWNSSPAAPGYPFAFDVVGNLDSMPAEVAIHQGRLFATTWPDLGALAQAGLWMSPVIPAGGLQASDAALWTKVWKVGDYEPDPLVAATYGGGALESWGPHLYWGTMHVPGVAMLAHARVYGEPADQEALQRAALGTHRAISIFRGRDFGEPATPGGVVRLVYGLARLPVYDPGLGGWQVQPNNMGQRALFGPCGFGNPLNNYTWTMDTYKGDLYIGTMDFSYVGWDLLPLFVDPGQMALLSNYLAYNRVDLRTAFGADLWRFVAPNRPAVPVSRTGVGNYSSYGVRTMVSDSNHLYLGMANPMNLLTDTNDAVPEGGWELIRLAKKTDCPNDFDGDRRTDLVSYRDADGRWFIEGSSSGYRETRFGFPGTVAATGDFDGDGRWDLGVYHPPSGRWFQFRSREGYRETRFGFAGTVPVTADFDGDGRTDIGVYHDASGGWYVFRSREGFWATQFGFPGTLPLVADFDGDGRADIGVYSPASGGAYLYRSTEGFYAWPGTTPGGWPAAADVDGDGRTEPGVFEPAVSVWRFQFPGGLQAVTPFGLNGSRPLTGDFDGDGIGDIGCQVASGGGWRMLNRGTGSAWSRTFGAGANLPAADGE